MSEKRGSKLNRLVDRYLGLVILSVLSVLLSFKRLASRTNDQDDENCLLVCFGAIGDLIVLTEAAQHQLAGKRVYLACSQLNFAAAKLYESFYVGIEPVNLQDIFSVHKIVNKLGVRSVFDTTQWANIGPIQVAIAELLGKCVRSVGFVTKSRVRNNIYNQVVPHSDQIHELGNFVNLMAESSKITSNAKLDSVVPRLYSIEPRRLTGKVLLHMWPSGNRSYLKEWPEASWVALIENLLGRGYQIYLSGSSADKDKTEAFLQKVEFDRVVNIAGAYGLSDLSLFIEQQIEFAICVNTGILHLVAHCGVPSVGLHGPTNPVRWGPLGGNAISLLPESGRSAYLHYGFEYPDDDVEAYALDRLSVSQVIKAVDTLLADR